MSSSFLCAVHLTALSSVAGANKKQKVITPPQPSRSKRRRVSSPPPIPTSSEQTVSQPSNARAYTSRPSLSKPSAAMPSPSLGWTNDVNISTSIPMPLVTTSPPSPGFSSSLSELTDLTDSDASPSTPSISPLSELTPSEHSHTRTRSYSPAGSLFSKGDDDTPNNAV